ncbi:MAG TPA: metal-binding protein [Blastocatellia bacterium]|nr:metal-binding protein [Blastocatellia bacterium]
MPSGRTHDFITVLLAAPTAAVTYYVTNDLTITLITTVMMIFGGLMFGPDLDIQSRQYARWGPLRFLWWPYKVILPHRSRLSHSILLGTLIRVIYFLAVLTLLVAIGLIVRDSYFLQRPTSVGEVRGAFTRVWEIFAPIKRSYLIAAFAGLWIGATSHTVSDVLGSFFKSVRRSI